jgi:hypothetical protein
MAVLSTDLATFQAALQAKVADYHAAAKNVGPVPVITIEPSFKYAKIVLTQYGDQRSAYGFIDLTSGDLLKADGWKKPAKHARGNLFSATPLAGCGPYGMAYLK